MKNGNKEGTTPSELRVRAEERLHEKLHEIGTPPTNEDNLKLIHELQVHQIELEMQNEELIRARTEIEANLEKYSDLYDFAPAGYFTLTDEGIIREVNLKGAALLGVDRLHVINQHFDFFVSDKTRPTFFSFLRKVFESNSSETCEVALSLKKDTQVYLHIEGIAIGAGTSIIEKHCRISVIDITERKRAEMALSKVKNYNETLIQASPAFLVIISPEGKTMMMNEAMLQALGYKLDEVVGKDYLLYFVPESDREILSKVFRTLVQAKKITHNENFILTRDGRQLLVEWHGRFVFNEHGELDFFFGMGIDITERKLAEEELNRYRDKLEDLVKERTNELEQKNVQLQEEIIQRKQAEEKSQSLVSQLIQTQKMDALGRFAGGIAHDLNNFLYPVLVNTHMLLETSSPNSSFHETLEQSLTALYRQRDLIKQILSFSRKGEQQFSPVHVKPLITETLAMLKSIIPNTVKIKQIIDGPLDMVMGDPTQIQQIVVNLCMNAADAMGTQTGNIEVILGNTHLDPAHVHTDIKAGEYLYLEVKDSGSGMTEEVMRHIFEPFFTTKEIGKGTGMGLAVIHGIIKSHGGVITVDSVPGRGTQFNVYLPLMAGTSLMDKQKAENVQPAKGNRKILLIDDEDIILNSVRRVLKVIDYDAVTVKSGFEAIEVFSRIPECFDLVITDMTMPGMTGTVLAEKIHNIRSDIPIILCTGLNDTIPVERAKEIGISVMLEKPADLDELRNAISLALELESPNS